MRRLFFVFGRTLGVSLLLIFSAVSFSGHCSSYACTIRIELAMRIELAYTMMRIELRIVVGQTRLSVCNNDYL
jgi:hypothetical protein